MLKTLLKVLLFFVIVFSFIVVFKNRELPFTKTNKIPATPSTYEEDRGKVATFNEPQVEITQPNEAKKVTPQAKTEYTPITLGQSDNDESYVPTTSPCEKPIGFTIGNFDPRFSVSKDSFIATVQSAANLWNNALGKTILYYDPNGQLTINLTYDERQAKTDDRTYLALDIENAKQNADTIKKQFESEKIAYETGNDKLNEAISLFETHRLTYETKVDNYNKAGGAPQNEYDQMTQELAELKAEAARLDVARESLLVQMKSINDKVARYNDFVKYINNLIAKSNALGGYKFTEGRFVPNTNTIDIYQYDNNNKLFRVIAHELGHALGINHTKNTQSIMYAVNTSSSTVLTKEDISALRSVCASN